MSATASAWERSRRLFRKARFVNSPATPDGRRREWFPPDPLGKEIAAVTVNLQDILAGIGVGGPYEDRQDLVDDGAIQGRDDMAVVQAVGGEFRGWLWAPRKIVLPIFSAAGPLRRIMAMPPTPGGVATAVMVSSPCMLVLPDSRGRGGLCPAPAPVPFWPA